MNALIIESTKNSPKISFNPNTQLFEIEGESRPENVRLFYEPVIKWLDEYNHELSDSVSKGIPVISELHIELKLGYFNSSSAKFIFDLLHKIHDFTSLGIQVNAIWYYEEGDEDMKQAGMDLSEMVDFQFIYVATEPQ